jgi:HEPN domain-containing protein
MTDSGCLLAQQSVEMFIKAILHLDHKSKGIHYLPKLLERGKEKVAYFDKLLNDPKLSYFIQNLTLVNTKMRFGEARSSVKGEELTQVLDEVAFNLNKSYLEIMKNKDQPPLYVPDAMKDAFLRNNKYFGEKDISNDIMTTMPLP